MEYHHLLHPQKPDIHSLHWGNIPAVGTMSDPIPWASTYRQTSDSNGIQFDTQYDNRGLMRIHTPTWACDDTMEVSNFTTSKDSVFKIAISIFKIAISLLQWSVDRPSAAEMVNTGSTPGRVKPKAMKLGVNSFPASHSAIKGTVWSFRRVW